MVLFFLSLFGKRGRRHRGIAQIPILIGLAIMIIALPVSVRLVQERQDVRKQAAGGSSAPACDAGDEGRTYGECCGCEMTREVRECTRSDGTKYWRTSDCVIPNSICQDGCPPPTNPGQPAPEPECAPRGDPYRLSDCIRTECDGQNWMKIEEWCSREGFKFTKTGASTGVSCSNPNPGCSGPVTPTSAKTAPTSTPTPTSALPPPAGEEFCSQQGGSCQWGECPSGQEALCVVGQDCFGYCGHDYKVCCRQRIVISTPTPTPTPALPKTSGEICQQQGGSCQWGECPSGQEALCVVGQDCFGYCGHNYSVCCRERVAVPTLAPTSTPTPVPTRAPTTTPKPTPTPKADSCPGQCKYVCNIFDEKSLGTEYCADFGKRCCVKEDLSIEPTPTPTPCRCVNGIYQGGSCESWMLGAPCEVSETEPMCAYRGKTYSHLEAVCSSQSELLTCNSGRWVSTICSAEGKVCSEGQCQETATTVVPARQDCRSLEGECRLSFLSCGEGRFVDDTGICGFGQKCCVTAKDCGSLKHGETICEGRDGYKVCVNGNVESHSCENGLFCQYVRGEGAKCVSSLTPTPTTEPVSDCLCQDGFWTGNCDYSILGKACGVTIVTPTPHPLLPTPSPGPGTGQASCSGGCLPAFVGCSYGFVSVGECDSGFGPGFCCEPREDLNPTVPPPGTLPNCDELASLDYNISWLADFSDGCSEEASLCWSKTQNRAGCFWLDVVIPTTAPVSDPLPSLPAGLENSPPILSVYNHAQRLGIYPIIMYEGFTHPDPRVVEAYNIVLRHLQRNCFVATAHEDVPESRFLGEALGCYPYCQFWNADKLHHHSSGGYYPDASIERLMLHERVHNEQEARNPGMADLLDFYGSTPMSFVFQALIEGRAEEVSGGAAGDVYKIYRDFYQEVKTWSANNGQLVLFDEATWADYEKLEELASLYQQLQGETIVEKLEEVCQNQEHSSTRATHKDCNFGI